MKTFRGFATGVSLLFLLSSCGESSLFIPDLDNRSDITILTIADGAVITSEDAIPVSLEYGTMSRTVDDGPDRMEIVLSDVTTGLEIDRSELTADELLPDELPPIELVGTPTGFYRLELVLHKDDRVVAAESVEFFYVGESYGVLGISNYPPSFFPGASGLLQANLLSPPDADPYLRWSMNEEVIAEGALSEGADEIILRSPEAEGVYPVTLELFPVAPADRLSYDFLSPIAQTTDLYVTENVELEEYELSPEISYYALFHFRGDARDTGVAAGRGGSSLRAQPIGAPDLRIQGDMFGYHFDGQSGFELDRVVVPFSGEEVLRPFSINLRILMESDLPGQRILTSESDSESFVLRLESGGAGSLALIMEDENGSYLARSDPFLVRPEESMSVSISVFPLGDAAFVMWFRDGILVGVSELAGWPRVFGRPRGTTVIGGEDGFVGIIDELGVYFQDEQQNPATYDDAFRHAMGRRYGETLVYAEDFAGTIVPSDLEEEGDVRVMTGELLLYPGARVVLPDFLFADEDLFVELDADAESHGLISIDAIVRRPESRTDEEIPVFALGADGAIRSPAEVELSVATPRGALAFRLVHELSSLSLRTGQSGVDVELGEGTFRGVSVALDQSSDASVPLRVHSVLVRRGQSAISRALAVSDEPE